MMAEKEQEQEQEQWISSFSRDPEGLITAIGIETKTERRPVPEPHPVDKYSGKFNVRVPRRVHRALARGQGRRRPLNLFVASTLAEAIGQRTRGRPVAQVRHSHKMDLHNSHVRPTS